MSPIQQVAILCGVSNGHVKLLPVKMQDAASHLLRITWRDVSTISVQNGLLTFELRNMPALTVQADTQDIPNLVGLIRGK